MENAKVKNLKQLPRVLGEAKEMREVGNQNGD
jgi:hypothetical protein